MSSGGIPYLQVKIDISMDSYSWINYVPITLPSNDTYTYLHSSKSNLLYSLNYIVSFLYIHALLSEGYQNFNKQLI